MPALVTGSLVTISSTPADRLLVILTNCFVEAAINGNAFPVFGDAEPTSDFTFVDDTVNSTDLTGAAHTDQWTVLNAAGGSSIHPVESDRSIHWRRQAVRVTSFPSLTVQLTQ
jgi:UDP-glucose 4-epimerase